MTIGDQHITFVCVETKGEDSYYESDGDYPQEMHTINYKTKVVQHIIPVSKAQEFYNNYLERNADNPPYDMYDIKLAFYTDTADVISLRYFEMYEVQG